MKVRLFLAIAVPWLALDRLTKSWALDALEPPGFAHPVLGNLLRWTLVFNRDAAMNLSLGSWSRWGFSVIAVVGVVAMLYLLRLAPPNARIQVVAIALVTAGALGNLIDRIRWDRGVVDFIDVGLGTHRFWTFNVADAGVTVGAIILAAVLSRPSARAHGPGASAEPSPRDGRPRTP